MKNMATAPELKALTPPISIHQPVEFAKRRRRSSLAFWLSVLLVLVLLCWGGWAVAARLTGGGSDAMSNVVTEEVGRGDLLITVTEDGNVESATNTDVKCQVAGGSTILWIIPDGSTVKKGDELVRLNSAAIEDQVNMQKIVYEKAQATRIESEKIFPRPRLPCRSTSKAHISKICSSPKPISRSRWKIYRPQRTRYCTRKSWHARVT